MDSGQLSEIAVQAVEWAVALSSGELPAAGYEQFEQWLARSAGHRQAWRRLHGLLQPLEHQSPQQRAAMREALQAAARQRQDHAAVSQQASPARR